jgi:selenocysteine-specific elongation factor
MRVIGTAGHVDHGKSTLVEALTGINPDRLKEERERRMTIDLGFAWMDLPNGEPVGIVDVPGHRDFIENMLAGVGGLDAVVFVVAADEGVMPQSREHLAIVDLLQIPAGVVALTKADLVDDDWLSLVTADLDAVLRGTVLAHAPIVPVSAVTGRGMDQLRAALQSALAERPARPDLGRPRLPIDRAFSLAGFGTVVTGTLLDGSLAIGDELVLLPTRLPARVRGLQTHKTKLDRAQPGSRVAANLAGVELAQVRRGMVLVRPGTLEPTTLVDVRLRLLPEAAQPLKHSDELKFFTGASEVLAVARLLESDTIRAGDTGWVQLQLAEPVAVVKSDRFIVRRPSPGETIGGGQVMDAHPRRRWRRRDPDVLARLETQARGTPGEMLRQSLDGLGIVPLSDGVRSAGLNQAAAAEALQELSATGDLIELEDQTLVMTRAGWAAYRTLLAAVLEAFHAAHPLRAGMPREELKSRMGQALDAQKRARWTARVFNALLAHAVETGLVIVSGTQARLAGHRVLLDANQQASVDALLAEFAANPYNTPSYKDSQTKLGEELLAAVVDSGDLVVVSSDVLFRAQDYASLVSSIRAHLQAHGQITVAEVRDLFSTSRKYALALMEHLDARGVTRRVGDVRVLKGT